MIETHGKQPNQKLCHISASKNLSSHNCRVGPKKRMPRRKDRLENQITVHFLRLSQFYLRNHEMPGNESGFLPRVNRLALDFCVRTQPQYCILYPIISDRAMRKKKEKY